MEKTEYQSLNVKMSMLQHFCNVGYEWIMIVLWAKKKSKTKQCRCELKMNLCSML